jgi:hypothetical protein
VNDLAAYFATTSAAEAAGIVADKTVSAPADTGSKVIVDGLIPAAAPRSTLIASSCADV